MKYFCLFSILFLSQTVLAKDFGIQGHCFVIVEENILEVIAKKLEKIDLDKFNEKIKQKTTEYVERPKSVSGITRAKENKVFYYDPSYVVESDIFDHQYNLLHKKGKVINPLEFTSLSQNLILIDGDDEAQVKLALGNKNCKIILVKGSPLKLQRNHKRWIYFDQAGFITNKLGISEVPALVEQEDKKLKISIIGDIK